MASSKKVNKQVPSTTHKDEKKAFWAQPGWIAVLLLVLSFVLYANTLQHEYAQDDSIVITENMYTTQGIKGWPGIFTKDTFFGYFKVEGKDRLVSGGRYRPLSLALFALEYQVFGDSPKAMHFFNIVWYGLTVVVCYFTFLLLWRAAEKKPEADLPASAHYLALTAALIFAVHPLHTEAVANIKGRDEILSLLGSMGALALVLRAHVYKQPIWLPIAFVVFLLGLLAKENAITFLAIVPLAFHLFARTKISQTLLYTAPFLVAAAVFLLIRGAVIGWDFGPLSGELMNNPFLKYVNGSWVSFSLSEKLATITYTLGKYLQLLFVPYPLTHDYYPRQVDIMSWTDWQVVLSALSYMALLAYGTWALFARRKAAFVIWFFIASLSIVSNLVFPIGTNMSERFLFMPSVAYALGVALVIDRFFIQNQRVDWTKLWAITGLIVLVYAGITINRNPVWKNNYTLFTSDIERSPNSAKLRNAMAGELSSYWLKLPNRENRMEVVQEAIGHAKEAIRIHPTYLNAYLILGNCYNYTAEYDKSIEIFQKALALDPNYEQADINLSATYRDAGRYYGEKKNDLARSVTYLQEAYRRNPTDYETLRLLGVASGISGDNQSAITYFTKALEQEPENAFAWYDLGTAYMIAGQREEADKRLARAKEIDPLIEERRKQKR